VVRATAISAFCGITWLTSMYVYHKKCVPKTFVDVLMYGNTLSKIPLCAAIDNMSETWKSQTYAKIAAWAVTLL
jgi:hypothetical protein